MEIKSLALELVQLKNLEERQFTGYASTFHNVDAYGDRVMPGAFTDTLKDRERPVRMRDNHYGGVIGKWLDLKEDSTGLWVKGELTPGRDDSERLHASMKHGTIDSLSIGYRVLDSHRNDSVLELTKLHLVEISVVEEPANIQARIGDVKSLIEDCKSIREFETFLREAGGFSKAAANAYIAGLKRAIEREAEARDPGDQGVHEAFRKLNFGAKA